MRSSRSTTSGEHRIELPHVRSRLTETELTQDGVRNGDVDAIVVEGSKRCHVHPRQKSADPYQVLVERVNEGVAALSLDGTVLFSNRRLSEMIGLAPEKLLGTSIFDVVEEDRRDLLSRFLNSGLTPDARFEADLFRPSGSSCPALVSLSLIKFSNAEKGACIVATDVSELKRAMQNIRAQAKVFELARDAMMITNLDHHILSWNRGSQDLYGWSADDVSGRISYELLRTTFPEPLRHIMAAARARGWEGELKQSRRDGRNIVVASRWSLLRDGNGNPSAILEVNRDITDRKGEEEALLESERFYRNLGELSPLLLWKCMPDGLNTYFNQRWTAYTGLTKEQCSGRGWDAPFHPDDKVRAWKAWNSSIERGEIYQIECRLKSVQGKYRWFLIKGIPLFDSHGKVVEWFGACTDIDDLKQEEVKLNRVSLYTRNLIEVSLDPIVTINRKGKIQDVNQATERVTGLSRDRLIGTDFSEYFSEPHKARQGYERTFADGAVRDYPLTICHASGGTADVLCNASAFKNEIGEVEGVFAAARDITAQKRLESERVLDFDALQKLNRELEARVLACTEEISRVKAQLTTIAKDWESFTYSVSHDLRAPLRHVDGFLTLLSERSGAELDATSKHYIESASEATRRMGRLIDELVQLSRLGRSELRKETVNLNLLVEEVRKELEPDTNDRIIAWKVEPLPDVMADHQLLRQLFENLLSNAMKFTQRTKAAKIEIGCRSSSASEMILFVRDNGAGFDMHYYDKLFKVFQRLHREGEFEGTGIGLAIARCIVDRHGGRIWAESIVGAGTTFYFSLPADLSSKRVLDEVPDGFRRSREVDRCVLDDRELAQGARSARLQKGSEG